MEQEKLEQMIEDYANSLPHSKTGIPGGWRFQWAIEEVKRIAMHFYQIGKEERI